MSRGQVQKNEFNAGLAMQHRLNGARQSASWAPRRAAALQEARDTIQRAGGPTVPVLKALGGLTQVLVHVVGQAPTTDVNQLGYPLNPDWYVWKALVNEIPSLRYELQVSLG